MNLSVVVPIHNEEEMIQEMVERISKVSKPYAPYEILCVDDGSTDASYQRLLNVQKEYANVKIIKLKGNHGQSDAFAAGFQCAKGDVVVTFDADLQVPPEEIPGFMEKIKEHDLVVGWRHERKDSFAKIFAGGFANKFRNAFLHDTAHDTGCPLKAFQRHVVDQLILFKGMHRFLPALSRMKGWKMAEVKVRHCPRTKGVSKYSTFGRAIPSFFDLLAVVWMRKRKLTFEVEKIIESNESEKL